MNANPQKIVTETGSNNGSSAGVNIKTDTSSDNRAPRDITRDALLSLQRSGRPFALLEALPAPYYQGGHLPGALNLPHDQVRALAPGLVPDRTTPVVVYCANARCQNSTVAAAALVDMGYRDVRVFPGGKQEWQDAGLPLEM